MAEQVHAQGKGQAKQESCFHGTIVLYASAAALSSRVAQKKKRRKTDEIVK
jgi:hypothetical protein